MKHYYLAWKLNTFDLQQTKVINDRTVPAREMSNTATYEIKKIGESDARLETKRLAIIDQL